MIDYDLLKEIFPQLLISTGITLTIAVLAALLGFIFGTVLGVAQSSKINWLQWLVTVYVTIIRGTPMLLQIIFLFFMLPTVGINISAFSTAVIAMGLNSAAYISQIIRSGIRSVSKGQLEAAKTLKISNYDAIRYIVLPQAIRVIIPTLGNEFITLIKDSSLASIIGVVELFKRGDIIISYTHDALSVYTIISLIYLFITTLLSIAVHKVETRINKN